MRAGAWGLVGIPDQVWRRLQRSGMTYMGVWYLAVIKTFQHTGTGTIEILFPRESIKRVYTCIRLQFLNS